MPVCLLPPAGPTHVTSLVSGVSIPNITIFYHTLRRGKKKFSLRILLIEWQKALICSKCWPLRKHLFTFSVLTASPVLSQGRTCLAGRAAHRTPRLMYVWVNGKCSLPNGQKDPASVVSGAMWLSGTKRMWENSGQPPRA